MHMAATCTTGSRAADDASAPASVTKSNVSWILCLAVQCDRRRLFKTLQRLYNDICNGGRASEEATMCPHIYVRKTVGYRQITGFVAYFGYFLFRLPSLSIWGAYSLSGNMQMKTTVLIQQERNGAVSAPLSPSNLWWRLRLPQCKNTQGLSALFWSINVNFARSIYMYNKYFCDTWNYNKYNSK